MSIELKQEIPVTKKKRRINWTPWFFLAIPLAIYILWIIAPTVYTIYLSFTNWDGVSQPQVYGYDIPQRSLFYNYERLFNAPEEIFEKLSQGKPIFEALANDKTFGEALQNNLRWLIVFITVPTTLGLGLALVFNAEMKGGRIFKVSFYAPLIISFPVIGLIWAWIYNPNIRLGLINSTLYSLGVVDVPGWLGDKELAIWAIIFAAVWRQVGYVMILYLAGLKNIDPSLIDASQVDGANRWQMFRHVIMPLLAPITTIIMVISVIDSLRSFDLVQVMTRGGQGTQTLANFMYIEAFNNFKMGYGAAIAVVLFGISLVFISFYLYRTVRQELEY
ncbi:sugar ABC transporter permease [Anaerolineales bacterium]